MLDGALAGRVKVLARVVLNKFSQQGFTGVLEATAKNLLQERGQGRKRNSFDDRFDTDTGGIVPLWKLNIQSPNQDQGNRYQASDPEHIRAAIEALPINPEEFLYIDIGSGKGLTLLVASEYPFRGIIGVEFSAELDAIAAQNIRKWQAAESRCKQIAAVHSDAASYDFPPEATVLFLYNPFGKDVMQRMLLNLKDSLTRADRTVYVIYSNPTLIDLFDEADFLERWELSSELPIKTVVYRHLPKQSA